MLERIKKEKKQGKKENAGAAVHYFKPAAGSRTETQFHDIPDYADRSAAL